MKVLFMTCLLLCSATPLSANSNTERVANYGEAARVFAFAAIMRSSLDSFLWTVAYDGVYLRYALAFGPICNLRYDEVYDAEKDKDVPTTFYGCSPQLFPTDHVSQTLFDAYQQTLLSAEKLRNKLGEVYRSAIVYELTNSDQAEYNKLMACGARYSHTKIAKLWKTFHNNYKREHQLYSYERRKHIINRHFIAIKRGYGLYASRLKKISQNIEREYDCDRDGPEASPPPPPNVGN